MRSVDLPAILGGTPLRPQGPPDWPMADEAIRQALEAAWRDGSWGKYNGCHVERLEWRLAKWTGLGYALTCGSGTLAVEVALRALQVGPGDRVALAAYDYPGNFLSVHAIGAHPVLVDVEAGNWNLSAGALDEAAKLSIKAVVVSHLHGGLVDMPRVVALCRERGIAVVEDAAQCPGATVAGRLAGTWGDVGVYSFGGSKLLSAGRGGALVTDRAEVHQRARLLLGRGNNLLSPLSELQAAVLLPQLEMLEQRHGRRREAVARLGVAVEQLPGVRLFWNALEGDPGYYKVGMQYDEEAFGLPRRKLVEGLRAEGVALDEGFRALHVGRSGSRFTAAGRLEQANLAHAGTLVLHHPVLLGAEAEVNQVAEARARLRAHREALG